MYNLSKDYEKLYELVQKGENPIYKTDVEWGQYLCKVQDWYPKEEFIKDCEGMNLRWIDPQPVAQEPQMNYEHLKSKMDAFFKDVEPEHLIDEFSKMGYEFKPAAGKWVPVFDPSAGGTGIVEVWQPTESEETRIQREREIGLSHKRGFAAGQQSIIEKLNGLQRWDIHSVEVTGKFLSPKIKVVVAADIEAIINQSK